MKITVAGNEREFDLAAAWKIIFEILKKPNAVIGLATGKTTRNIHALISEIYKNYPFDVSKITFFGVDEVTNVPRDYKGACFTMLKTQLIDALSISEKNFLMPPTFSDNWEIECLNFQKTINLRGGADFQVLGLGENGHIGFNQPGTPFDRETWVSEMDAALEKRIRAETATPAEIPLGGLTLGIATIMRSQKILLVAKGASKAEIVKKLITGQVTTDIPASILQLHPHCEILLDKEAAKLLN